MSIEYQLAASAVVAIALGLYSVYRVPALPDEDRSLLAYLDDYLRPAGWILVIVGVVILLMLLLDAALD